MERFCIITNTVKDSQLQVTNRIREYLEQAGRTCQIQIANEKSQGSYHYTNPEQVADDVQCIIVLGGDGTLLQAARDVVKKGIPLLGINLGTLGFLAEVGMENLYQALDQMMQGNYTIEKRMMLKGSIYRGQKLLAEDIALNDIVIGRRGVPRVVRFKNYVNDEYLNTYNADGIIISTPTGSTGYSLSAGGPIISPSACMISMTPLAPHTLNTRSIIFSADDKITVEIGKGRRQDLEEGMAFFDGDTQVDMVTGDRIVIRRAEVSTKIMKLSKISFLEVLRQKMRNS